MNKTMSITVDYALNGLSNKLEETIDNFFHNNVQNLSAHLHYSNVWKVQNAISAIQSMVEKQSCNINLPGIRLEDNNNGSMAIKVYESQDQTPVFRFLSNPYEATVNLANWAYPLSSGGNFGLLFSIYLLTLYNYCHENSEDCNLHAPFTDKESLGLTRTPQYFHFFYILSPILYAAAIYPIYKITGTNREPYRVVKPGEVCRVIGPYTPIDEIAKLRAVQDRPLVIIAAGLTSLQCTELDNILADENNATWWQYLGATVRLENQPRLLVLRLTSTLELKMLSNLKDGKQTIQRLLGSSRYETFPIDYMIDDSFKEQKINIDENDKSSKPIICNRHILQDLQTTMQTRFTKSLIYGPYGSGKTTLAKRFLPKPPLVYRDDGFRVSLIKNQNFENKIKTDQKIRHAFILCTTFFNTVLPLWVFFSTHTHRDFNDFESTIFNAMFMTMKLCVEISMCFLYFYYDKKNEITPMHLLSLEHPMPKKPVPQCTNGQSMGQLPPLFIENSDEKNLEDWFTYLYVQNLITTTNKLDIVKETFLNKHELFTSYFSNTVEFSDTHTFPDQDFDTIIKDVHKLIDYETIQHLGSEHIVTWTKHVKDEFSKSLIQSYKPDHSKTFQISINRMNFKNLLKFILDNRIESEIKMDYYTKVKAKYNTTIQISEQNRALIEKKIKTV